MYSIFTLLFIIVIFGGLIWAYFYYLDEKAGKLQLIEQGICPECRQETIEIADEKSGGCSGVSLVQFECSECGYKDSYAINGGSSCGGGSCKR